MGRGDVFRLRVPRGRRGSEQRRARYAVVVQADELLARSFRPTIDLDGSSTRVLVEQTTAVSSDRLGESVGRLSASELSDLDTALALVLGL